VGKTRLYFLVPPSYRPPRLKLNNTAHRRLIEIGDYYEDHQIKVSTRLTEIAEFEDFIGK
jgi:hypothetical protein